MKEKFNKIGYYLEFIKTLTINEYKIQYKSKKSAFIWTLVFPIVTISAIYFFLSFFTRLNIKHYNLLFLAGFIPWQFFFSSLNSTIHCIKQNTDVVKKIYFPYIVIPVSMLIHQVVPFAISLSFLILLVYMNGFTLSLLSFVLLGILTCMFLCLILGAILILSSTAVFIKELPHAVNFGLSILFYISPVLYPLSLIPLKFNKIYLLNPIASIIVLFRRILLPGEALNIWLFIYVLFFSLIILITGIKVFNYRKQYFADCVHE